MCSVCSVTLGSFALCPQLALLPHTFPPGRGPHGKQNWQWWRWWWRAQAEQQLLSPPLGVMGLVGAVLARSSCWAKTFIDLPGNPAGSLPGTVSGNDSSAQSAWPRWKHVSRYQKWLGTRILKPFRTHLSKWPQLLPGLFFRRWPFWQSDWPEMPRKESIPFFPRRQLIKKRGSFAPYHQSNPSPPGRGLCRKTCQTPCECCCQTWHSLHFRIHSLKKTTIRLKNSFWIIKEYVSNLYERMAHLSNKQNYHCTLTLRPSTIVIRYFLFSSILLILLLLDSFDVQICST